MSTLYKRNDSPYWWWSSKVRGKRERMSTGMRKKSLAEQVRSKWDMLLFKGDLSFLKRSFLPSSELNVFVDEYLNVRSRISENTYNTARGVTTRFVSFLKTIGVSSIGEINMKVLDQYIDYLDVAPKTVHNHVKELKMMLKRAVLEGLLKTNPAEHVILPKIKHKIRHRMLEAIDLEIIFTGACSYRLFYEFLYYTGLRAGDVAMLTYKDIDFKRSSIVSLIHKSDRFHELPLANELISKLTLEKDTNPLFPSLYADSKKKLNNNLAKPRLFMQSLLKSKSRPKATLHSFRTTFNNTLRDLGLSMDDRQQLMSHSSSETTKIYTHSNFDLAKKWIDRMPKFD